MFNMAELKSNKSKFLVYLIIIVLIISVSTIGIDDYRNILDKNHYKMLYDEKCFEQTEIIQDYAVKLKYQVDFMLASDKIGSKDVRAFQNYSQELYFNYMELHASCINNSNYYKYNIEPRCNFFYTIRNYAGYLNTLLDSSSSHEIDINSGSDISKSLRSISDICGEVVKVFQDYTSGTNNETALKAKMIQADGWVTILNKIAEIFNGHADSADIITNSSGNYSIKD